MYFPIYVSIFIFLYLVFDGGKFENVDNLFIPAFKSTELETSTQVWNGETLKDTFTHQTKEILECLSIHIYPLFDYMILKVPWTYSDIAIRKHFPEMHRHRHISIVFFAIFIIPRHLSIVIVATFIVPRHMANFQQLSVDGAVNAVKRG